MLASPMVTSCAHCGRKWGPFVEMLPGKDGQPWGFCGPCYVEGLKPMYVIEEKTTMGPTSVNPRTGDLTQWETTRRRRVPNAKDEVANFDRMTEGGAKPRPKQRSSR